MTGMRSARMFTVVLLVVALSIRCGLITQVKNRMHTSRSHWTTTTAKSRYNGTTPHCLKSTTDPHTNRWIHNRSTYLCANVDENLTSFRNCCTQHEYLLQTTVLIIFWRTSFRQQVHMGDTGRWKCEGKTIAVYKVVKNSTCNREFSVEAQSIGWLAIVTVVLICALCFYIGDRELVMRSQAISKKYTHVFVNVKQSSYSVKHMKHKIVLPNDIFKFRMQYINKPVLIVYPFSLNQYVNEIVKRNRSGEDLMKYEWARYLSFKTFPQTSVMTPMRLTQAGFFYTGTGEEVKCFCCGVTNGQWSTEETAWEVHVRLSPGCDFINGERTNNATIHTREYYATDFWPREEPRPVGRSGFDSGACGRPSDMLHQASHSGGISAQRHEGIENNSQVTGNSPGGSNRGGQNGEKTSTEANANRSQAKHPQYDNVETRMDTFSNWTLDDVQNPRTLAEEGFFYTGVRDFVRCFFCGIGLKNWGKGGNPRGEHIRWSPACGFLLQNGSQPGSTSTSCSSDPSPSATNASESNRPRDTGPMSTGATSSGKNRENPKNTDASAAEGEVKGNKKVENATGQSGGSAEPGQTRHRVRHQRGSGSELFVNVSIPEVQTERNSLIAENRSLRQQLTCKICMDRDSNVVFLPCGHKVACQQCAQSLRKCAICRKLILRSVHVYQG